MILQNLTTIEEKDRMHTLYYPMPHVKTIAIGIMVKTGSRHETLSRNGISHFLEHMAFKGTRKRNARQIAEEFDRIGAHFNAYTSRDRTFYHAHLLSEHGTKAFELLSDILQNSIFDEKEIERERGVILQELARTKDTPDDILFDYLQEVAYPDQPFGRSILGLERNIKSFKKEDFMRYMDEKYTSDNIVISVAGEITEELKSTINKEFSPLMKKKKGHPVPAVYNSGDVKVEKDLEQTHLAFGFESRSVADLKGALHDNIASSILGGGMSSILFQTIREERGLAYTVSAFCQQYDDTGMFTIYSATKPSDVNELILVASDELHKATHTIKEDDLQRAKVQFKSSIIMGLESSNGCMRRAARSFSTYGRIIPLEELCDIIDATSVEDITASIKSIVTSGGPVLAATGKCESIMPFDTFQNKLKI